LRNALTIQAMPTLITHARPTGPQCQQVLPQLQLPNLSALLRLLSPGQRQTGEEDSLSPLHELLKAQALGIQAADGLLPWAALQAHGLQRPLPAGEAWAWLTPCHWQVNTDHVRMADPLDTQISAEESCAVMDSLRPYLLEDGITLHGLQGGNWLATGAVFGDLPTASLARASGGAVDHWMPRQAQAKALRRLQNEMQMLLYTHPVNDARAARRLLPINSFWVSGTGTLPPGFNAIQDSCVLDALRESVLADDAAAWLKAWQALDGAEIKALLEQARRGEPVELTLCGETAAQTFTLQPQGLWTRLSNRFAATDIPALLQAL
jgi:hypothetical protein